jgi:hypothetical protein
MDGGSGSGDTAAARSRARINAPARGLVETLIEKIGTHRSPFQPLRLCVARKKANALSLGGAHEASTLSRAPKSIHFSL